MAKKKENVYSEFLRGKKIPILTLDNKWHTLFPEEYKSYAIKKAEKELNSLIQKQGQLNNDIKDYKKLKNNLMKDIMENMEAATSNDIELQKKQTKNQKYILEINDKLELCRNQLETLPNEIEEANERLMMICMETVYENLKSNDERITELSEYITQTRASLTKALIDRDELQEYNANIYGYMHDIFGAEITTVFDIKYKAFQPDQEEMKGAFVNAVSSKKK